VERFASPSFLWLLLLVPALLALRLMIAPRARPSARFSSIGLVSELRGGLRRRLRWLPLTIRLASLALLIIALARPQFGQGEVKTSTNGVAMMIAVDRSASMDEPLRSGGRKIEVVKDVVKQFVAGNGKDLKGRPGDMIGLCSFAKYADTVCPLVRVHDVLTKLVDRIQLVGATAADPEAGTAIGEGLALAAARLKDVERELTRRAALSGKKNLVGEVQADESFTIKSKVIVLLTDGEENMGEISAAQAAQLCKQWGIKVYTIGIGAGGVGGRAQRFGGLVFPGGPGGFNDAALKQVAEITGGKYFPANDAQTLSRIYQEIDALEKTEIKTQEFTTYDEKFTLWAAVAAVAAGAEALLIATLFRRTP